MTTTEKLLAATQDLWESYNEHPFVKGIEDGTLDKRKFRYYILQDYLYLQDYAKSFAIGIAKAKSLETVRIFSGYIALLTGSEMNIHHGYMGKLGVTQEELDSMPRALDNLSYTSYMLRIAYEEGEAEILTAILSCALSYEVIARRIVANNPDCANHPFYGEWVIGYASEEYAQGNIILVNALNNLTQTYTEQQTKHLIDIFVNCSRYESLFWDLSWKGCVEFAI